MLISHHFGTSSNEVQFYEIITCLKWIWFIDTLYSLTTLNRHKTITTSVLHPGSHYSESLAMGTAEVPDPGSVR